MCSQSSAKAQKRRRWCDLAVVKTVTKRLPSLAAPRELAALITVRGPCALDVA